MAIHKWQLKAFVQKTLSFLPFGSRINFWFQKHVTRGVRLTDDYMRDRLVHARDHMSYTKQFGGRVDETLEIGTGWYPIIPLLLYLEGAGRITTLDVRRYVTPQRLREAMAKVIEQHDHGDLKAYVDVKEHRLHGLREALGNDSPMEKVLEMLGIRYLIGDARHLPTEIREIDLVHSNNTLEHIPEETLRSILLDLKRVGKAATCVHSHFVDMGDHFAHMDRSITVYNFLKFSKRKWRRINNNIQYMNRLRLSDYGRLFSEAGYAVVHEQRRADNPADLGSVRVHPEFDGYDRKELQVTHVHFVCR